MHLDDYWAAFLIAVNLWLAMTYSSGLWAVANVVSACIVYFIWSTTRK